MRDDIKQRWIAALRSGEYQQGIGKLRSQENRYCCLGVLCELYRQDHPEAQWQDPTNPKNGYKFTCDPRSADDSFTGLPVPVREWAGFRGAAPFGPILPIALGSLATNNDNGSSFVDIATMIEVYL